MSTESIPRQRLNDGRTIPQLGFGVFQIPPKKTGEAVQQALRAGYRAIDTAAAYRNETEVGQAIAGSGLDREQVFVTTKLWNASHGAEAAPRAFERSLERLGDVFVDLYLIHWPVPRQDRYVETWRALIEFRASGRARSVGVSNFEIGHLERIIAETGVAPTVNQIELHPRFQQRELRRFHAEHQIITEAWSPLGQGAILDNDRIAQIASACGRTPAQVVLRWHVQLGNIVIPKSVTPARIEENIQLFDFELSDEQMNAIAELDDADGRIGPDPETFVLP